MRIIAVIYFLLIFTFDVHAQSDTTNFSNSINKYKTRSHQSTFYVSMDVLSILNTVVSPEEQEISIWSEICVDHLFGFRLNTSYKNEHTDFYDRSAYVVGPEIRWYKMNENCSALHFGVYCNFEEASVSIGKSTAVTFFRFRESIFEAGISGGYKVLLNDRLAIDPAAYVGLSNRYRIHILDEAVGSYYLTEGGMVVRVELGIGYKF